MFGHKKVKPSKEELMAKVEVLQRDNEHLYKENNSAKETVANLNSTISTNREEIGKLQASVITLTTDAEKSSAKIQELEAAREALDKVLEERTQSLSGVQSQYNTEKERLEDELCASRKANEMLNGKLQKEEGETATLRLKITSLESTNLSLNSTITTKEEEIGKLQAHVKSLTMDIEKASAKIQGLEISKDASSKALCESIQSLSTGTKMLQDLQSQCNAEKKGLEDELNGSRKQIEVLNEKLQKEKGDRATLCLKIASLESTNLSLNSTISTNREEIGELQARVRTLTTDAEKSSAALQELERARDTLEKALKESTQSLNEKAKELSEVQSQYNTEKKRLEDELYPFRKEMEAKLKEEEIKRKKEEEDKRKKEEEEIKRRKEEEDKLTEQEKRVRSSVQPRSNTPVGEASSAVFTPITCTESICKHIVKAEGCCYSANALDINKYNVLAVADGSNSVYLYSETNNTEEKLCTCPYGVLCLAWNQQGTLLAIGGYTYTIDVWDITNRKITKWLKFKGDYPSCFCLDWKGDTITAGTSNCIYQWNINEQDNDQDVEGNKALLPRKAIKIKYFGSIMTVQWSNCKSKLATITDNGDMCIYDEELKLIHHHKAHNDGSIPLLQWCPWDNQVIVTCCIKGYLKIWRVQQGITLSKEVKHESEMANIKWIPSKNAIITGHWNHQLVLWEYPSLSIIRTIKGHTRIPRYLALNADKSALVSKSQKEMIFWKPFDQF